MKPTITITKDKDWAIDAGEHQWNIEINGQHAGMIYRYDAPTHFGFEYKAAGYSLVIESRWAETLKQNFEIGDRKAVSVLAEVKRIAKAHLTAGYQNIQEQYATLREEAAAEVEEAVEAPEVAPTIVELIKLDECINDYETAIQDHLDENFKGLDLYDKMQMISVFKSDVLDFDINFQIVEFFDLLQDRQKAEIAFAVENNILTKDEIENPEYSIAFETTFKAPIVYKKSFHINGTVFASLTRYDDELGTRYNYLIGEQHGLLSASKSSLITLTDIRDDEAIKLLDKFASMGFKMLILRDMINKFIFESTEFKSSRFKISNQMRANKREIEELISKMDDEFLWNNETEIYERIAALSKENIELIEDYKLMINLLLTHQQVKEYKAA